MGWLLGEECKRRRAVRLPFVCRDSPPRLHPSSVCLLPIRVAAAADAAADSWGASSIYYDDMAAQVDLYSWQNPQFLAVIAAGNDGSSTNYSAASGVAAGGAGLMCREAANAAWPCLHLNGGREAVTTVLTSP